jgi:2-methylcitrate dehydratase PrpD
MIREKRRMIEKKRTIADYLARLVHQIGATSLSGDDCSIVRRHMLDAIASAFVGCRSSAFRDLADQCSSIEGGGVWPGSGSERVGNADAAMLWAFAVNASVFEDGSREGACHPAAAVMPVVISSAGTSGWELIDRAVIAGYDVMVRLARGGNPDFTSRGFHPTSITAPFAAAAAGCVLSGYDVTRTQNALCLAAQGCAGLMSSFKCGATQPLQVAMAVRSGVLAASMAGKGHKGYARIIDEGFYPAYLGHEPDPPVDHPLAHGYAIHGGYLKPYPGCRHLHPAIDAFRKVLEENEIEPGSIKNIMVGTYRIAVETEIHEVRSRGDAYFNIPYALSARALLKRNDFDAFGERHFTNESLMGFMKKVKVEVDPEMDRLYPGQRGAIVEVHMADNKSFVGKVFHPLGEPENPLPVPAILGKFRVEAGDFLSKETMERVETLLHQEPDDSPKRVFESLAENKRGRMR